MSQLSDALAAAQSAAADFKDNPPPQYVTEDLVSGKPKYTSAYTTRLGQLEATIREYQKQVAAEAEPAKPPPTLTTAPTPDSQAAIANQRAADELKRQQDKDAEALTQAAAHNKYLEDKLGLSEAVAAMQAKSAASLDALRQAQIQGKDVAQALAQAKFDLAREGAAQMAALKDRTAKLTADVTQRGQDITGQSAADTANTSTQNALLNLGGSLTSTFAKDLAPSAAFGDVNESIKSLGDPGYKPNYTGSASTPYDINGLVAQALAHISPTASAFLNRGPATFTAPPIMGPLGANPAVAAGAGMPGGPGGPVAGMEGSSAPPPGFTTPKVTGGI